METDGSFHDLFSVDYKQAPWYEWREECASPDRYRFELAMHSRLRLGRWSTRCWPTPAWTRARSPRC